jgi:hypothetical protein
VTSDNHLIILTRQDYEQLRRDLKAAGLDLCYMAQAGQPIRLDWTPDLLSEERFLSQVARRRPTDLSYPIASVVHTRAGGWLRPDEFMVTFHGVGVLQEEALRQYLSDHHVQSSQQPPSEKRAA